MSTSYLDPLNEQLLVLLQQEELPQHDVGLVESLALEPLAKDVANARQVGDGLLAHGLGHEVPVLLRGGGHGVRGGHLNLKSVVRL